jgi:hypothetical protein
MAYHLSSFAKIRKQEHEKMDDGIGHDRNAHRMW